MLWITSARFTHKYDFLNIVLPDVIFCVCCFIPIREEAQIAFRISNFCWCLG